MRCSCGQESPLSAIKCPRCGKLLLLTALGRRQLLRDAGAGVSLLIALGLVFLFDRGRGASSPALSEKSAQVVEREEPAAAPAKPLRLAVTRPEYDDMGKLLDTLGSGYRYTQIDMDDLLSAPRLDRYDAVFVTCSGVPREWLGKYVRQGARGTAVFRVRPKTVKQIEDSLRHYVGRGGTLYASDWQFDLISMAFPEFIDDRKVNRGDKQTVVAEVVDAGLLKRLGPQIELRFDQPSWRPAAFDEHKVSVLLSGSYKTLAGKQEAAPLLVQFPFEQGVVVFTSFHNEKQNSRIEQELLRYLVFTTVTARLDAHVKQTMIRGGFSPAERNLLSASAGAQSVAQDYECRQAGPLQFVLGFEDRGAELRLVIVGPDGRRLEQSGKSTFTLEVAGAAAGKWTYTVTPVKVPYENFPFTLTIGEKVQ